MRLENDTPFEFMALPTRPDPPQRSLTFILKGTFDIKDGGPVEIAKKQRPISGDKTYLDDIGRSLSWATDMAPFKPHTDFYVIGSFHQPDGKPGPVGQASFRLGPLYKELNFFGRRLAVRRPNRTWSVTEPEPMTTVPLRWEYSFGGLSDRRNPMGLGIDAITTEEGVPVIRLPLIEDPRQPIRAIADRPPPANFAPVPANFQARRRKLGTRDRAWSIFRAPLPPNDYDPSYHNAAPDDQQAGNYPRGDETLTLTNLHPQIPILTTQLPSLRPRIGILRNTPEGVAAEDIAINLDTIVALPDEDQLVLVWRGMTNLQMSFLPDEMVLYRCELEKLDDPPTVPPLPQRMLAAYQDGKAADQQAEAAQTANDLAEMYKLLEKANIPPALMSAVKAEPDPLNLYKLIDDYLTAEMKAPKAKYSDILPDLPA